MDVALMFVAAWMACICLWLFALHLHLHAEYNWRLPWGKR